jgi:hypothetical protein
VGVGVAFRIDGIVILLAGTLLVGLAPWRSAPGVGALLALIALVALLICPTGLASSLRGAETSFAVGQETQLIGVLTAVIAGAIATRTNYRTE